MSKTYATLLLMILLGTGLRVYHLDDQSMWSDEGLSLYRARQPLNELWDNIITVDGVDTQDTSPPFYFLLLHIVRAGAGESVFALRFLGAMAGIVAVPLMYQLGTAVFNRHIGLISAVLMAISPFHVWQSQILRNYGLLITLNLFSVYGLIRFLAGWQNGRFHARWLLVWVAAGLLGIYTHYFGFFIFAFGVASLITAVFSRYSLSALLRQRWVWSSLAASLLILVPVLPVAISRFMAGRQVDFYYVSPLTFINHAASAFSVGMEYSLLHPWWRVLPVLLGAALGILVGWQTSRWKTIWLLGYQLIPFTILLLLSTFNPLYNGTRHLLIGLPPFLLLVAGGLGSNWRYVNRAAQLTGLFIILSQAAWLHSQYTSPRLRQDDVQGVATFLNEVTRPGDVVLVHDTLIRFTFDYYYHGAAPVVSVPQFSTFDVETAVSALAALPQQTNRIWFLAEPLPRNGFPRTALTEWAAANWHQLFEQRYPAMWLPVNLQLYQPSLPITQLPATATPTENTAWEQIIRLHGYELPTVVTAGQKLIASFYWTKQPTNDLYSFSLRLIDTAGTVWGQVDSPLDNSAFPFEAWPTGQLVQLDKFITIPAGMPPGTYQVQLRLVNATQVRPVPTESGVWDVVLGQMTVEPALCHTPAEQWPPHVPLNTLVGPDLVLRGYTALGETYRPGHALFVDLFWCASRQPRTDYRLKLSLVDATGGLLNEAISPLTAPHYPPAQWQAGQLVMGKNSILIPANATGQLTLKVSLLPPDSDTPVQNGWFGGAAEVVLSQVQTTPWPMETELPPITSPLQASFGAPPLATLQGYELTAVNPNQPFSLTLFWRGESNTLTNYFVFIHLIGPDGQIVAQQDGMPLAGSRPTTSWRAAEVLVDEHTLFLNPDVPSGDYQLWAGFYNPDTGERLPVFVDGVEQADGRILLTTLQLPNE